MPTNPSVRLLRRLRHAGVGLAVFGLTALAAPMAGAAEATVGKVSLMIGDAKVVRRDGTVEPLRRGASILVGDRLETASNGHVHVRFIDSAAVSVRPDSVLEVQAYRFDADNPKSSEVRLQLDQGASRSISGRATEADKSRFRLNTPLAAIGVRGTDFIVHTSESGIRATVAEGAIVVGALGAGCAAAGLGPCSGAKTSVLSADMGRLMVELSRGDQVARLVPVAGALLPAGFVGSEERVLAQRAAESSARSTGIAAAEPFRHNDRAAAELLTIAAASTPNLNSASDRAARLAWGRYTVDAGFNDNISQPFVLAQTGRHVTVGDTANTLFRADDPASPDRLLAPTDAKADFRLSRAQATFEAAGKVEAASVDGGTLSLDFGRRTFGTALALSSATGGKTELRMAGDVRADGTFSLRDGPQSVAGAVSLDGKEAGYLFERGVGNGLFKGKTLWGR